MDKNLNKNLDAYEFMIPHPVEEILRTLRESGFEGYAVGGCVRDTILGRVPEDWDITTSAKPEQVKALFRRTLDTGIKHGTVTVMFGKEGYEVTTYRMDGEYEDHRHPKEVQFTPNLIEDLKRRDFTINAMAYSPESGIVDEFDGIRDMKRKCIRCVGKATERFEEDALRMLRGVRFAGQLQFEIERATFLAMKEKAPTIVNVSAERIRTELTKLLLSDGADRLLQAVEAGLTEYFLPELDVMLQTPQNNPHHCYDVGRHSIEAVRAINQLWREVCVDSETGGSIFNQLWRKTGADDKTAGKGGGGERLPMAQQDKKVQTILVYAALLHDVAKPDCLWTDEEGIDHFYNHNELGADKAEGILRRLKFDNETIDVVTKIIRYHDCRHENCWINGAYSNKGKRAMRRLMNRIGVTAMPLLFLLQRADLLAQSDYTREEKLAKLAAGERCFREILEAGEAVTVKDLAIGGREIMELGLEPGPKVGKILQQLLELVMEEPGKNTAEILRGEAEKRIAQGP